MSRASNADLAPCDSCGQVWGNHGACQAPDTAPGPFFVTARDGRRISLACGPFPTHPEALAAVSKVEAIARGHEPRAFWWSWGTSRWTAPEPAPSGVLDRAGLWPPPNQAT